MLNAKLLALALGGLFLAHAVQAQDSNPRIEIPRGLWQTEPTDHGVVYHVRTRECGRVLCGRIERVKDRRGLDTRSTAVSHLLLDRFRARPDGSFEGKLMAPASGVLYQATLTVLGSTLAVRLCEQGECRQEVWRRLR